MLCPCLSLQLSYLVFLALFSYMVLIELRTWDSEEGGFGIGMIVWGWAVTLIIEEWRQVRVIGQPCVSVIDPTVIGQALQALIHLL